MEAVKVAISVLENDPLTNAGYGSNLTYDGEVECDASVMDGTTLTFGGCGAVSKLQNPIELAYTICINQRKQSPIGLVPPLLLAGKGGLKYARKNGLKIVNSKRLISAKALRQHQKYKKVLDSTENNGRMDTVGAVCLDGNGHVATGSSSGGLILKQAGRVGQAALFGSSCWADSCDLKEPVIAVCTTGCGEQLIKTQLAKEIADGLKFVPNPTESLHGILREKFLESRILRGIEQKLGGALVLHENSGEVSVLWAHSTETMSVGFMKLTDKKPRVKIPFFFSKVVLIMNFL